jgi:hypothetical protein
MIKESIAKILGEIDVVSMGFVDEVMAEEMF